MSYLQQNAKNCKTIWRARKGTSDSGGHIGNMILIPTPAHRTTSWDEKIGVIHLEMTEDFFPKEWIGALQSLSNGKSVSLAMLVLMRPFGKLFDIISFF